MQAKKVATFVFIHFESTTVPKFENTPRAIEMCVVAVQRQHFANSSNAPSLEARFLNKLNLCFCPKKLIPYTTYGISDLCNDELQDQKPFNEDVATLLILFLQRLPAPVCLLAHAGNEFDFRLLQAELKNSGCTLSEDILCADTGLAFSSILEDVLGNNSIIKNKNNSCSSTSTDQKDENSISSCSKAINLTTNSGNFRQTQFSCIQSSSCFAKNDSIQFSANNFSPFTYQNVIKNLSSGNNEEDEVEVITIKKTEISTPFVKENKENDEKETGVEEFPVIDLTEDSSVDGSTDEAEAEEEEGNEDSDDSNIIIENENNEVTSNCPTDLSTKVAQIPKLVKINVELPANSTNSNPVKTEQIKDVNDSQEKADSSVKSDKSPGDINNLDEQKLDDTDVLPISESNGVGDANDTNIIKNSPKKRIRDEDEDVSNKKFAGQINNTEKDKNDDEEEKSDDSVSSTVLKLTKENSPDQVGEVKLNSNDVNKSEFIKPVELPSSSQESDKLKKLPKCKHTLSSLHQLLLGQPKNLSHSAEVYIYSLMRICQVGGIKLRDWIDVNAVPVNQIDPLW